jgi:hypothetical protein
MNVQKSFVNTNGIAIIKCPACGIIKNLSVAQFLGKRHVVKIRCSCNCQWDIQLDFRRTYRKKTKLAGTYTLEQPASGFGLMTVLNISRSGVGFSVTGLHEIKIGLKVRLRFTLDDKKCTLIDKLAVIKAVKDSCIGCEFIANQIYDKDLGFYLQP